MFLIHPTLVHFPIALLSVGLLFDLIAAFSQQKEMHRHAWWMMVCGMLGLLLALGSGLNAETQVTLEASSQAVLDSHKQIGFLLGIVVSSAFLWRLSCRGSIPTRLKWLFWALYVSGVSLVWLVAWYGGILVHEHGVSGFSP
jgi:uncharacterized membrane protein